MNNLNNILLLKQAFKKRNKKDRQCKRDFTSIFFIIFYNFSTILNNLNSRKIDQCKYVFTTKKNWQVSQEKGIKNRQYKRDFTLIYFFHNFPTTLNNLNNILLHKQVSWQVS